MYHYKNQTANVSTVDRSAYRGETAVCPLTEHIEDSQPVAVCQPFGRRRKGGG